MLTGRRAYPRWLVRGLVVFALGMTVFAAVASRNYHSTEAARNTVLSRLVALESREAQRSEPALARRLAVVAYRLGETTQARSALLDTAAAPVPPTPASPDRGTLPPATASNPHAGDDALRQTQAATSVTGSALSPNGQLFAAAGSDHRVWLWNVSSPVKPQLLANLTAARGRLTALAFSAGGDVLVARGANQRLTFWLLQPAQAVQRLCALGDTRVTAAEWKLYVPDVPYDPPCR